MRLTAELLTKAPSYLNAVQDRELDLRSHKIPAIENLGVTRDLNDSLDLTDNDIRVLGNFPSLPRLKSLLLANNRISKIDGGLSTYIPNLTLVVLTNNAVAELADLEGLLNCSKVEILSLQENPVTKKKYYRLYVIWKMKGLRVLDFQKVKLHERQEAKKLFETKTGGPSALAESIAATKSATFEPGEGVPLPEKSNVPTFTLTKEEQERIKTALSKATTMDEITRLERALKEGKIPNDLKEDVKTVAAETTSQSGASTAKSSKPNKRQKVPDQEQEAGEEEEEEEEETEAMQE